MEVAQPILLASESIENTNNIRALDDMSPPEGNGTPAEPIIETAALTMEPVDSGTSSLDEIPETDDPVGVTASAPTTLVPHSEIAKIEAETDVEESPQYEIRIAALSQLDNIEVLKARLESIGPLTITPAESASGSVFYRINMGPFSSLEMANERLDAVREAGYDDAGILDLQR